MPEWSLTYRSRVIEEKDQLSARIKVLMDFFSTAPGLALVTEERRRMQHQVRHMIKYESVLIERIAAFGSVVC